jgi:serine/threonine protein phosphatase PrpC
MNPKMEVRTDVGTQVATSEGPMVSLAFLTDVGRVRKGNEDALIVADLTAGDYTTASGQAAYLSAGQQGLLLAVADGMGGASAGEVASFMAVEGLATKLIATAGISEMTEWLRDALKATNSDVYRASLENPEYNGMGATMTAAIILGPRAIIGQVGDSRCYRIHGDAIEQVTKDQSYVQAMIDAGIITQEDAARFAYRNVIMQALGVDAEIDPVTSEVTLAAGDHLLLCSDGLSNKVNSDEMFNIVCCADTLGDACKQLINLANKRGGEDNITVILARLHTEAN